MKCPNCDFIEKDEAFGEPATCPKCGAIYEKALRIKADKERQELFERKRMESAQNNHSASLKDRFVSASTSVSDGREKRVAAGAQSQQRRERQMVIVADIDMPFWSMVNFMIKWALASVPALFILALIVVGAVSILRILFS